MNKCKVSVCVRTTYSERSTLQGTAWFGGVSYARDPQHLGNDEEGNKSY